MTFRISLFVTAVLLTSLTACERRVDDATEVTPNTEQVGDVAAEPNVPDWTKDAVIYEVNTRIYSSEGTFAGVERQVPRLADMGVDILWFMPVHPVSEKNRKGSLGSPYAVADYKNVNPEFGTLEDFNSLVSSIHDAGMHVIIDWVPNHSGWDNDWITEHPDFYTKKDGQITDPINPETGESWGWTDVADLDFSNQEMRDSMIAAMKFWVEEVGIDGFRVDVAHGVPVDFWEEATKELYAIKPLFMLAEAEIPEIVNNGAFVMDYGWEMHHLLNNIAKARGVGAGAGTLVQGNVVESNDDNASPEYSALDIDDLLAEQQDDYERGYQMQFTSNHDENAWAGTEFQRFGDGAKAFAVLTATFNGMPLIYSGQESAVDRQFEFFERDSISWGDYDYASFYRTLFDLKERNKALWNGQYGGPLEKIETSNDEMVYAFTREKDGDKVAVIINLSAEPQQITLEGGNFAGEYDEIFTGGGMTLQQGMELSLEPWEYFVMSNK